MSSVGSPHLLAEPLSRGLLGGSATRVLHSRSGTRVRLWRFAGNTRVFAGSVLSAFDVQHRNVGTARGLIDVAQSVWSPRNRAELRISRE